MPIDFQLYFLIFARVMMNAKENEIKDLRYKETTFSHHFLTSENVILF